MTSKRMRQLCVPAIFGHLVIRHHSDTRVNFPDVLNNVRVLALGRRALDHNELAALLNVATRVQEISCEDCYELTLARLFKPPSLQLLNLCDISIPVDVPPVLIGGDLRAFSLISTNRFLSWLWDVDHDQSAGERSLICLVLEQTRSTLETLVLPGESISLSYLAKESWPVLQELVICGVCPTVDIPILEMLAMMPALRFFTWAVAQRKGARPLLIWSPGAALGASLPVGKLERLVVSWPSADDLVFPNLGQSLTELSLRDTPRYYSTFMRISEVYAMPALDCGQALAIMHAAPIARLRRLELVFVESGESDELALYALLASSCPELQYFELHRYRSAANVEVPIPVGSIAEALSRLTALQELCLNLDFPEVESFQPIEAYFFVYMDFLDEQAKIIARALPWLDHLCILHEAMSRWHDWGLWTIRRALDGDPEPVVEHQHKLLNRFDMHWL